VATGASPVVPDLPGADLSHVLSGWRVIAGLEKAGQSCVVIGGGLVAMEVADSLAEQGKKVIMIVRSELLKKAVHADRVYYMDRIAELDIEVLTDARPLAIGRDWVEISMDGRVRRTLHDIDSVIFCTGYQSRKAEIHDLESLGIPIHYAGDVGGPRKFFQAIEEGTLAGLKIV
jgi:pyruvate/2-oxoglutarate dehydrogenase complex dihydrolipoamide dehydrogenase (E3) component